MKYSIQTAITTFVFASTLASAFPAIAPTHELSAYGPSPVSTDLAGPTGNPKAGKHNGDENGDRKAGQGASDAELATVKVQFYYAHEVIPLDPKDTEKTVTQIVPLDGHKHPAKHSIGTPSEAEIVGRTEGLDPVCHVYSHGRKIGMPIKPNLKALINYIPIANVPERQPIERAFGIYEVDQIVCSQKGLDTTASRTTAPGPIMTDPSSSSGKKSDPIATIMTVPHKAQENSGKKDDGAIASPQ